MARRKIITIKPHQRVSKKGTKHKVHKHTRHIRVKGKKVTFKPVGTFLVGHDELGNFRGSKVKRSPGKKPVVNKSHHKLATTGKATRRRIPAYNSVDDLDTEFFRGELSTNDWLEQRKQLMDLDNPR